MDVTARIPTEAESLDGLRELIGLWGAHDGEIAIPALDPLRNGKPPSGTQRGLGCWVQAEHAVRSADAAVLLWGNDMVIQAVPSIRMIHECAVTAVWFVQTPGSGHAAVADAQRHHALLMTGVGAMTGEDTAKEVTELFKAADEFATAEGKHFEKRCSAITDGSWLYPWYRMLSQFSHGGANLLNAYAVYDPEDDSHGHGFHIQDPTIDDYRRLYLGVAVATLHMAMAAWDAMDKTRARTDGLAAFADARGFEASFEVVMTSGDAPSKNEGQSNDESTIP